MSVLSAWSGMLHGVPRPSFKLNEKKKQNGGVNLQNVLLFSSISVAQTGTDGKSGRELAMDDAYRLHAAGGLA